jgi:thioredoxin-like negative regulator of GroEL
MYPCLSPYGIIMKVNHQTLPELTEDILRKDHEFWTQYSRRFIGDWISYDTSLSDIAAFVEKVYLHRDFSGFTGNRKFIRDNQAQLAFSKLRSAIAGLYAWRLNNTANPSARQRIIKEADFAFRQAFALCPYSPEAFSHYVNFLVPQHRFDDAILVASTCLKLDPFNGQVRGVINDLRAIKNSSLETNPARQNLEQLEKTLQASPSNLQAAFDLAGAQLQLQQTNRALAVLDSILHNPNTDPNALRTLLQAYTTLSNRPGLQATVDALQARLRANPSNFDAALGLAEGYQLLNQPPLAVQTLDRLLNLPQVSANAVLQAAQQYAALLDYQRLQAALEKLTKLSPEVPEVWYDLAALKASLGNSSEALSALRQAFDLSAKRLHLNPKAKDLLLEAQRDPRFTPLQQLPEFKQLASPKP